jgi:hypothetical protein
MARSTSRLLCLLAAAAPLAFAAACGNGDPTIATGPPGDDAGTTPVDATAGHDAASHTDAAIGSDTGSDAEDAGAIGNDAGVPSDAGGDAISDASGNTDSNADADLDANTAQDADGAASPPDAAGVDAGCDLVAQNCGAGMECTVFFNADGGASNACTQAGPVATGAACGGNLGGCAAGDICIIETSTLNVCLEFCNVDSDCKNMGACAYTLTGTPAKLCTNGVTGCNTTTQMPACPMGEGCYIVTPDGRTGCHQTGAGAQGAMCNDDYDCQAGFLCFSTGAAAFCGKICDTMTASSCASPLKCYGINGFTNTAGACGP